MFKPAIKTSWSQRLALAILICVGLLAAKALAQDPPPLSLGPLDFKACVQRAIAKSPYFTKSALEIDIRKLDESDALSALAPTLTLATSYYTTVTSSEELNRKLNLVFTSQNYKPWEAYFTHSARKLATRMAVLYHAEVISQGIARLGGAFLELDALGKMQAAVEAQNKDTRQALALVKARLGLGEMTAIDLKRAEQLLAKTRAAGEQIAARREIVILGLKQLLDWPTSQRLELELASARGQVLGSFDAASLDAQQAYQQSFTRQIKAIMEEIQGWRIVAAKAAYLPALRISMETADPLNTSAGDGYYLVLGLNWKIWDNFSRSRDISRQRIKQRQIAAERRTHKSDYLRDFQIRRAKTRLAKAEQDAARSSVLIAEMELEKLRVSSPSNPKAQSALLAEQIQMHHSRIAGLQAEHKYNLEILGLKRLSGQLIRGFVSPGSWEQPPDNQ